jgi:hypothetical protein
MHYPECFPVAKNVNIENFYLGDDDMKLSQKLSKAGSEHCKHLRMIQVWMDLTLPRYIWSEFDTYKFNTKISCSTMHKITSRHLTTADFEEGFVNKHIIEDINNMIDTFNSTKDASLKNDIKRHIKMVLPEGFLQKRTLNTNYAELLNMHFQRENHKLVEWHKIDDAILQLPYFIELTGIGE